MKGTATDYEVRDFMSRNVLTIGGDRKVSQGIETMIRHKIGCLVVRTGKEYAAFTERGLLRSLVKEMEPETTLVKDVISRGISKVEPTLGAQEAARRMVDRKARLLVFEMGKPAGIVTATDIVKVIYRRGVVFEIGEFVSREPVTVEMGTPLKSVVRLMEKKGVGSVIVTENRVPRGIFTERDLLNKVLYLDYGLDEAVIEAATYPMFTAGLGINGRDVAGVMVTRGIKRLPLTKKGKVVAIVTARDLVHAYAYPSGIEDPEIAMQLKVRYGELCPICNTRIDERGLCSCGAGGA